MEMRLGYRARANGAVELQCYRCSGPSYAERVSKRPPSRNDPISLGVVLTTLRLDQMDRLSGANEMGTSWLAGGDRNRLLRRRRCGCEGLWVKDTPRFPLFPTAGTVVLFAQQSQAIIVIPHFIL